MGLYDNYRLANSNRVKPFVGSAVPELFKVAGGLEQKFQFGVQNDENNTDMMKSATAAYFDQPLLNSLKEEYKKKIEERAKKGDYENMWRDTVRDSKDFVHRYKPIAENQQRLAAYQKDLGDQLEKGHISKDKHDALLYASQAEYNGLKFDADGNPVNKFTGITAARDVDMPKKINEWISSMHPTVRGQKVEYADKENKFYVTEGSTRKYLTHAEIKPIIDAGMAMDPEVQAYLRQEAQLAPYKMGYNPKMSEQALQEIAGRNPWLRDQYLNYTGKGMNVRDAFKTALGDRTMSGIMRAVDQYGRKGIVDEQTYERGLQETTEYATKQRKGVEDGDKVQFGLSYVGGANTEGNIKGVQDFDALVKNQDGQILEAEGEFNRWKSQPHIKQVGDRYQERQADGTWHDVTEKANQLQSRVAGARKQKEQLAAVKYAATQDAQFDPAKDFKKGEVEKATKSVLNKSIWSHIGDIGGAAADIVSAIGAALSGGATTTHLTGELIKRKVESGANERFAADLMKELERTSPKFHDYNKALVTRMNGGAEVKDMIGINDDNARKDLKNIVTNLGGNGIGLEKGLVSMTIGTGADQGTQLTPDQYNSIEGNLEPVGIINEDGKRKIVMRSTKEVKGKKVLGENIIVEATNVTGLGDYLKKTMKPEEFERNEIDLELSGRFSRKSGNTTGRTTMMFVDDKNQPVKMDVEKVPNADGSKTYRVHVPMADGTIAVREFGSSGEAAALIQALKSFKN